MSDSQGMPSRRAVVGGVLGLGLGVPLVAACGSGASAGSSASGASGGSSGSGGSIAKASDIPVGSGKIFDAENVVVTQPTAGQFKAFSAICTHQGCPLAEVTGAAIDCNCHGSQFSIKDGSVLRGPATQPLAPMKVVESGGNLTVS